jgi:hypothetical protein
MTAQGLSVRDAVRTPQPKCLRGTGQSVPALLGGHVQVLFAAYPSLAGAAESKKVKLLAQNGEGRWFQAPDVPAVSELVSNFDLATIVSPKLPLLKLQKSLI